MATQNRKSEKAMRSSTAEGGNGGRSGAGNGSPAGLEQVAEAAVEEWQTPQSDSLRSRSGDRKDEMGLDQKASVVASEIKKEWPPPNAGDGERATQTPDGKRGILLPTIAKQFP